MKRFWVGLGILCALIIYSGGSAIGFSGGKDIDAEIRSAICEIENGNFRVAHSMLENILKKEPLNIYALRLLPGTVARQIKDGDKSAGNLALIRKAIEAYERTAQNPAFNNERTDISRFIITLYEKIGGDEKYKALLKKAQTESPDQQALFYIALAADNYACANNISDAAPVKSIVKRGGTEIYVFRKPQNPADFDKLQKCAVNGSELSDKAIALDPMSDTAWSYKASFYAQLARIAEMEGKPEVKAQRTKEYSDARNKFQEVARSRLDEQKRISAEKYSLADSESDFSFKSLSDEQFKELQQELKNYRAEKSLAETVDRVYIPLDLAALVAPAGDEGDTNLPPDPPADRKQPRNEWKTFAPEGGFSAYLPANAGFSSTGNSRIYTASDNDLSFFIIENAQTRELPEGTQDMALNVLAWTITKYFGNRYIGEGTWNDSFESELIRKAQLNTHPARFYAYRMNSCKETKQGIMIFVISGKKSYAIDIKGAGETDERIQRFLKSLKLN